MTMFIPMSSSQGAIHVERNKKTEEFLSLCLISLKCERFNDVPQCFHNLVAKYIQCNVTEQCSYSKRFLLNSVQCVVFGVRNCIVLFLKTKFVAQIKNNACCIVNRAHNV